MAPAQEIAVRALGTALAGLAVASAIHVLAYGRAPTRIDAAEYAAMFAEPRGQAVEEPLVKPSAPRVIDMEATGSLPAASKSARLRPAKVVAARAERAWLRIDGARRQAVHGAPRSAP